MGSKIAEGLSAITSSSEEVTSDILVMNFTIVTACLVGDADKEKGGWVLVDAGPGNSADFIIESLKKGLAKTADQMRLFLRMGISIMSVRSLNSLNCGMFRYMPTGQKCLT